MTDPKGNAKWTRCAVWTLECGRYVARVEKWINGLKDPNLFYAQISEGEFYLEAGEFYSLGQAQDAAYAKATDPETPATFEQLREVCEESDREVAAARTEFDKAFGGLDALAESK